MAPVPHHVIAVAWQIRQLPRPTVDAPTLTVSAGPDQPFCTSVLAIGELAHGLAYAWGMDGHAGGAIWKTRTYSPGRLPGMATGPHGEAIVHTLTTWGASHAAALWQTAQLLAVDEPGEVLSAWTTQDHLAGSFIVGIPLWGSWLSRSETWGACQPRCPADL